MNKNGQGNSREFTQTTYEEVGGVRYKVGRELILKDEERIIARGDVAKLKKKLSEKKEALAGAQKNMNFWIQEKNEGLFTNELYRAKSLRRDIEQIEAVLKN